MILPSSRVMAFDHRIFVNDVITPLSVTVKPATVVQRYGIKSEFSGHTYPDLIDVVFDHRPCDVSKGHFTEGVKEIAKQQSYMEIV